jgi:phosphoribosyl-ATP pyrophosphohydrolase
LDVRSGELFSLLYEILMEILGTLITVRSSSQQRGRSYVGEEDTGVVLNLKLAGWKKMVCKKVIEDAWEQANANQQGSVAEVLREVVGSLTS